MTPSPAPPTAGEGFGGGGSRDEKNRTRFIYMILDYSKVAQLPVFKPCLKNRL